MSREIRPVFYDQDKGIKETTRLVDQITHPANMSLEEAREFLEALQMEIENRLEALREDIKNETEMVEKDTILS